MQKSKLLSIIQKYTVGGREDTARWKVTDNVLTIAVKPKSAEYRLDLEYDFKFEDSEFGINNTSGLLKILSALDPEFTVGLGYERNSLTSLLFQDSAINVNFMLGALEVISELGPNKPRPDIHLTFDFDKESMSRFAKSLNALKGTQTDVPLAILTDGNRVELILNHHPTTNTNRISLELEGEVTMQVHEPLYFNANLIGDIFDANKDFITANISVSKTGWMLLSFEGDGWKTDYQTHRIIVQ